MKFTKELKRSEFKGLRDGKPVHDHSSESLESDMMVFQLCSMIFAANWTKLGKL
jgi:hypothetical protein